MARVLSLYVETNTFVQRLDPMVKLLYILVAVLISFVILPFRWGGCCFYCVKLLGASICQSVCKS